VLQTIARPDRRMPSFRALLYRLYWKAESFLVPGLTSSQYAYYDRLRRLVPGKVWLDAGCGHQVFGDWMTKEQAEVIASSAQVFGIDADWPSLKQHTAVLNKAASHLSPLPFRSESFDVISANMVVEHLYAPEHELREIHRVLRPNGVFVFHTTNRKAFTIRVAAHVPDRLKTKLIWFLERRREADVYPTHYRINTPSMIRKLAAKTNFSVEDIRQVSTSASTVMLGPVAWFELLYLRCLEQPKFAHLRSNLVVTLRKR
jgi:ubiquinone/menaquinone biosynthesis C-methylase UbiE